MQLPRRFTVPLMLSVLVAFGLAFRLHNVTPYNLYPDSYQNLLLAHNVQMGQGLVGPLGRSGMAYPYVFDWTRPMYPFFIAIGGWLGLGLETAGHTVSVLASLAAMPLGYLLLWLLTRRWLPSLLAAAGMAISFSNIVWSGYVMTEATGVLAMLLLLCSMVKLLDRQIRPFGWQTTLAGVLLAACMLTRYEYALMVVPLGLMLAGRSGYWRVLAHIVVIAAGIVGIVLVLFVRGFTIQTLWADWWQPLAIIALGILATAGLGFAQQTRWFATGQRWLPKVYAALAISLVGITLMGVIDYGGLYQFATHDFILMSLGLAGLYVMLDGKQNRRLGVGLLVALMLLGGAYAKINADMWRYFTHLTPLLIVPAALQAETIACWLRRLYFYKKVRFVVTAGLSICILLMQIGISYTGMHDWDGGIWFQRSYEQLSAEQVRRVSASHDIVVAALPEPYFFYSDRTTYGVFAVGQLHNFPATQQVIIVDDFYLVQLYPDFAASLETLPNTTVIARYPVVAAYRFITNNGISKRPVTLYRLPISDLRNYGWVK